MAERTLPLPASSDVSTVTLLSDGEEVSREHQILSITVVREVNRIPTAKLVLLDGDVSAQEFRLSDEDLFKPGKEIEILAGYHSQEETIFKGIVVRHGLRSRSAGSSILSVVCKHPAVKMTVGRHSKYFLEATDSAKAEAFQSMLDQALFAFTYKLAQLLNADRCSLFLVDLERDELRLRVAQDEHGRPIDHRMPRTAGIAGHVATTGERLCIEDAYTHPLFNPTVDLETGYRTRSVLCLPLRNRREEVFAVAQLLNRKDGKPFDEEDEKLFDEFSAPIAVIFETFAEMTRDK